jgi:hypothetical protein
MSDRLSTIKERVEYAPAGLPCRGEEDLYWCIREIDRLRQELTSNSTVDHITLRSGVNTDTKHASVTR